MTILELNSTLDYRIVDVNTTVNKDYQFFPGKLFYSSGSNLSNNTISPLKILNDDINEKDEQFRFDYYNTTGSIIPNTYYYVISDTLRTPITNTIEPYLGVENLTLTANSNINGTGNSGNNILTGNNGDNILNGLAGNDTLRGEGGKDLLIGGDGNDVLYQKDNLFITTGNDTLFGGKGDDTYNFESVSNQFSLLGTTIGDEQGEQDQLLLTGLELTRMKQGKGGFARQNKDLLIDANKNGKIDITSDIVIQNFFEEDNNFRKGNGFIEKFNNFTGDQVLNLFALSGKETVTSGISSYEISFEVSGYEPGKAPDSIVREWDKKPIWIVTHGWMSDSSVFRTLSNNLKAQTGATVLLLDWKEASSSGLPVGVANTWVNKIADVAAKKLKAWGFSGSNNLNFVGHSLGTLLNDKIAQNLGGSNRMIALDPPSDYGYVDRYINQPNFALNSNFSRAFVGDTSGFGNGDFAKTADEAYVMDFNDLGLNGEHSLVHHTFAQMLDKNKPQLINNLLPFDKPQTTPLFQSNSFNRTVNFGKVFEGVINVKGTLPQFLTYRTSNSQGSNFVQGTTGNDTIKGKFLEKDILTGGDGSDRFVFDSRVISSNIQPPFDVITDFKGENDKIILSTGFSHLGVNGKLKPSNFALTTGSPDLSSAKIVFDRNTKSLYHNANGSAPGFDITLLGYNKISGGLFVQLNNVTSLSVENFEVF
jgi:Ca2+-binding RTX toxin-like protein